MSDPDIMPVVDLLRPSEVAAMAKVTPKTVARWTKSGHLASIVLPGGHRRYPRDAVEALLRQPQAEKPS